jgi:hypothetical protein
MELALEMGMPFEQLKRVMTERELQAWSRYTHANLMPSRRLELYMAQLTCWVVRMLGNKNANIEDFIIELAVDDQPEKEAVVIDLEAARDAFQFKPKFVRSVKKE